MDQLDVKNIFRESFLALTKRIANIELLETVKIHLNPDDACMISVSTRGTFHGEITCVLDKGLAGEILNRMTGGREIPGEEQGLYIKEYMNIVCGNGLTRINNLIKASSRLTVPCVTGKCHVSMEKDIKMRDETFRFHSSYGDMKVCIRYAVYL